ncbi:MAG: thioredoxin domain-containing protein [Candidatus Ancillula sp.]|jgi:protein-disulfide isomerase|nr:thioredoxin domain-containing protein [Candidatus Ancillula sp.]
MAKKVSNSDKNLEAQARLNELLNQNKKSRQRTYIIVGVICAVLITLIIVAIVYMFSSKDKEGSSISTQDSAVQAAASMPKLAVDTVWHPAMLEGNQQAPKLFREYSDPFCPYCYKLWKQINDNRSAIKSKYLDQNKFKLETRVLDSLSVSNGGKSVNSTRAAEYTYCASRQNKFQDFWDALQNKINDQYYSKGIGAYHGAPEIPQVEDSFYTDINKDLGLDESKVNDCITSGQGLKDLGQADKSASEASQGLPAIVFGSFKTNGFAGDWNQLQAMFESGLK